VKALQIWQGSYLSTGEVQKRGGDLGLFGRGVMVKEFEEAAFKLNKGEITPNPIKTEFGYHIVKRAG
jgi:peptidyl-prolyl cis-trans isomerase C